MLFRLDLQGNIKRIINDIAEGISISDALKKHPQLFPKQYLPMIKVGEQGDKLSRMLEIAACYLEAKSQMREKIAIAVGYPITLVVIALFILGFLAVFVIPAFKDVYLSYEGQLYLNMVKAGEETGNLARVLYQLIQHFQEIAILKLRVRNALIYPAILITTSLSTLIFILTVTVPSFVNIFDSFGANLPLPTRIVINVSMFIKENILIFGFGLVIIFLLIIILSRIESLKPAIDRIKLRIPFVGKLLRDYSIFHFCRTLGDLLTAGVPIIESLALSKGC